MTSQILKVAGVDKGRRTEILEKEILPEKDGWTREQIAAKILGGDHLVVYHDLLLRIPSKWLAKHPGGALAILHFVGRDASDEIDSYHPDQVLDLIRRYKIGTVSVPWTPLVPPVAAGWVRTDSDAWFNEASSLRKGQTEILLVPKRSDAPDAPTRDILEPPPSSLSSEDQSRHSAAYKQLHQRVRDAGLYNTRYIAGYGPDFVRYALLASISAYAYLNAWYLTSALFLGLFWQQLTFFAHDLGHVSVTHNWAIDRLLGILIADWIGGLSIGWWVDNHNVHHLVTNHPTHDPDIEHLPFIAITPVFFHSLWSSYYKRTLYFDRFSNFFVQLQHRLFYIVLALARFNLYANSYPFLVRKAFETRRVRGGRWAWALEIIGIGCFWWWYGRLVASCGSWQVGLGYFLISHIAASPVHVQASFTISQDDYSTRCEQIVLSHFSMSTEDLGPTESFPDRQLRTTTDVICPDWLGWIHGGLQLQVTHHLFPRLPRHNLKAASFLVKEFAREQGLIYAEFGWIDGNQDVLGVLRGVADQVRIMGKVVEAEMKEAIEKNM
ncbi:delta 8-sphingoloid desaturase protein, partial [Mycena amicta]